MTAMTGRAPFRASLRRLSFRRVFAGVFHSRNAPPLSERISSASKTISTLRRRLSSTDPNEDSQSLLPIVDDCIAPRLRSVAAAYESISPKYPGDTSQMKQHLSLLNEVSRRVSHVEWMIWLVQHHSEFSSQYWTEISHWQQETYRENCHRLLLAYKKAMAPYQDSPGYATLVEILTEIKTSAYQHPIEGASRIQDVFTIRNVFDEPGMRAFVTSENLDPALREQLQQLEGLLVLQQPAFPPSPSTTA